MKRIFGRLMGKTFNQQAYLNARQYLMYCLAFLFFFGSCTREQPPYLVRWAGKKAVGVAYLRPENAPLPWSTLRVRKKGAKNDMLGNTAREGDYLVFAPVVPFTAGSVYELYDGSKTRYEIRIPYPEGAAPRLLAIYPNITVVPENLLKFYLHFSSPMRQGNALSYISLLDAQGKRAEKVFLSLEPELWDSTGTVLTVWLDPGRIKRGLTLNASEGNPLQEGKRYTLQISGEWKDTRGISLGRATTRQFNVGKRDDLSPDVSSWSLQVPVAGEAAPVFIYTAEPLDHYLVPDCARIFDSAHQLVNGKISPAADALTWKFTPSAPWKAGQYSIEPDPKLEDLAGNNLGRLFDRDLQKTYRKPVGVKRFVVK